MKGSKLASPEQELQRILDHFQSMVSKYKKLEPRWMRIALLQMTRDALSNLRSCIDTPESSATWLQPRTRLSIETGWRWTQNNQFGELYTFVIEREELNDRIVLATRLTRHFSNHIRVCALQAITDGVATGMRDGKVWSLVPAGYIPVLQELADEQKEQFLSFSSSLVKSVEA